MAVGRSMSKILVVGLLATIAVFAISACGSDDPTPTPVPVVKAPATPTPAPEPVHFIMNGGSPFFDWFIAVTRRIMEEKAPGVVIDVQAIGGNEQVLNQLKGSPELIPNMMLTSNEAEVGLKAQGLYPPEGIFSPPGEYLFGVSQYPASQRVIMHIKKDEVKTLQDLDGRRVVLSGTPKSSFNFIWLELFKEAGIAPKVDYMPTQDALAALHSGIVDAQSTGIIYEGVWAPGGNAERAKQDYLGIVDIPPEVVTRLAEKRGWDWLNPVPIYGENVKALSRLDYNFVHPDVNGGEYAGGMSGIAVMWAFHESAPEAAVYEFSRTFLENLDYFEGVYAGPLPLYKARVGHAYAPQTMYHPGARRAFEELGVTYGIEGIREWEAAGGREEFYVR